MRAPGVACQVVYSKHFDADLAALDPSVPRREELLRGVEWVLGRTELRGAVRVVAVTGLGRPRLMFTASVEDQLVTVDGVALA